MTEFSERLPPDGVWDRLFDAALAGAAPLMPCDTADAYNLERIGRDRYRLTLAAPGLDERDIDVDGDGGCLRITGQSRLAATAGDVLHRGLDGTLDRTFLMTRPLAVTGIEVRCGLLRIFLREQPGAGVQAAFPPYLNGLEALALAA